MASSLEGNKILAAILTAGIIASGAGVFSRILYTPHMPEENAYQIEIVGAEDTATTAVALVEPIAVRLTGADASRGEVAIRVCASCHTFEEGGANRVGPNLWDVVGHPVGAREGYSYSPAMAGHGGEWDYQALDEFLANPRGYVPGTKMTYAGMGSPEQRADLIAYLRGLSAAPAPLPEAPADSTGS
jgi:cytochrome c